jgi:hypothetical protein
LFQKADLHPEVSAIHLPPAVLMATEGELGHITEDEGVAVCMTFYFP